MRLILRVGKWGVADIEVLDPFQIAAIIRESRKVSDQTPLGFVRAQTTEREAT
jgi:hypothetical protein